MHNEQSWRRALKSRDALYLLAILILTIIFVEVKIGQHSSRGGAFLNLDESHNFLIAQALMQGKMLYKDIAYQYGYLPAYVYTAAARMFGNSISTYLHCFAVLNIVVAGLIYGLLRRFLGPAAAFLATLLALIPQTLAPGSLSAGFTNSLYYPLEKILLLCAALLWREPARQNWRRALWLGACLGAMQGVKFGGGLVLGIAVALVELLCLIREGFSAAAWRNACRHNLAVLSGFLLLQSLWALIDFVALPPAIARDTLWPTYMLDSYASIAGGARYPRWFGLNYFLSIQVVPLLGFLGVGWCLWDQWRRLRHSDALSQSIDDQPAPSQVAILILPFFYVVGCFLYFKQMWLFYSYAWTLVIGGAYLLTKPVRAIQAAALLCWLIGFGAFAKNSLLKPSDPTLVAFALDNGEQLWVTPAEHKRFTDMLAVLRAVPTGNAADSPTVFYPLGAGFHVFFHLPQQGRCFWFMPGFVRPYDNPELAKLAARAGHWVIFSNSPTIGLSSDPADWDRQIGYGSPTLSPFLRAEIAGRLSEARKVDDQCWIFSPSN